MVTRGTILALAVLHAVVAATVAAGCPASQEALPAQGRNQTSPTNCFRRKLAQGTSASVPAYVDWVAQGKVTPPQAEGSQVGTLQCNACWAFATASAVESKRAIEQGQLVTLSRQQLVDCVDAAHGYPQSSCQSGSAEEALTYIVSNGVATEAAYGSYTGQKSVCKTALLSSLPPSQLVRLSSPGYREITPSSATALMQAVSQQPVIVHLWWRYADANTAGIFNGPCPNALADSAATQAQYVSQYGPGPNNAAVVVGYDATKGVGAPGSYWKVKQSRGPGYTYFPMLPNGTKGKCGMYAYPLEPSSTTG